jgi:hypothetical protein
VIQAPIEQVCADAVTAVKAVLKSYGIERPSVVVNFAWKDPGVPECAVGTAVPKRYRAMLYNSLARSVDEAS